MSFDLRCWDEHWRVSFTTDIRTIRVMQKMLIPSGAQGSLPLSALPSGLAGVTFMAVTPSASGNIAPYAFVADGQFNWRGSAGDFYLTVLGIAEESGGFVMDGDSP